MTASTDSPTTASSGLAIETRNPACSSAALTDEPSPRSNSRTTMGTRAPIQIVIHVLAPRHGDRVRTCGGMGQRPAPGAAACRAPTNLKKTAGSLQTLQHCYLRWARTIHRGGRQIG